MTASILGWNEFLFSITESCAITYNERKVTVELGKTNQAILDKIREIKPRRVVIDSLTELKLMAGDSIRFRRQILAYKQFFAEQNITALLLDDKTSSQNDQEVQSIVNGIIILQQLAPEYGSERRRIRVSKLRAVSSTIRRPKPRASCAGPPPKSNLCSGMWPSPS